MDILHPESPELVRMLEQKWTRTRSGRKSQIARDPASWKRSLGYTWAVLRFEKEDGESKPPDIKVSHVDEPTKSVSEMLKEMRLKDGG